MNALRELATALAAAQVTAILWQLWTIPAAIVAAVRDERREADSVDSPIN